MATYVNNLRLKEIATGDESGTWGTSTNTNLELIGEALGIGTEAITTNANTHTTTVADGSSDAGRAIYLKYTGALDSDCTITIGPNTMKRVHIIENATTDSGSSGPYNIIISQGSGSNVTIANGKVAVVQLDGAGSGAAVLDAFTDLQVTDSLSVNGTTLTIGDATAEDTKLVFDGNAQDYYIGLDDSADDLVIGLGSAVGTTPAIEIDENQDIKFAQSIGVGQAASSTAGDIVAQTMSLLGTTPTLTLGDGGEEDVKIQFNGVKDFYIANDDSADKLLIGEGSTVGTNPILTITDDTVTLGDGAAVDTALIYDGNAKDFYIALDDSADKLVIGEGSTVGTNGILTIDDDSVTIGDGAAVDTKLVFDGNAQDYYIGLDDSADDLVIGLGSAVGTTPAIEIDENQDVKFAQSIGVGQAASSTTGDIVAQTMALKGTTPTLTIGDVTDNDEFDSVLIKAMSGTSQINVGDSEMTLSGDVYITENLRHSGDANTRIQFTGDRIRMYSGNVEMLDLVEGGTDYVDIIDRVRVTSGGDMICEGDVVAFTSTTVSDINQKENIKPIKDAVSKVKRLAGVTFDWKKDKEKSAGVIAQDVEKVLPEIVKQKEDRSGEEFKSVDYNGIIGLLVEGMKEQQEEIEKLKKLLEDK